MSASFDSLWSAIEGIGRSTASGGYHRFALTRIDHELREWFSTECRARGLTVTTDRMNNQWGWWGDPDRTAGVVTGSHLDSVPDGGAYDGPLGVISALAAIEELRGRGFQPARPIGVVSFGDEEGARFGVACAGSRVITGALAPERALALTDEDGISMADALRSAGHDPAGVGRDSETLRRVGTFVELHVEQGRGLVDLGHPLALATSCWPHGRWRLDLPGEANHAGTTRMGERRDALVPLAESVLAARAAAITYGCVATIGKVAVRPGGVNAIAGEATAWLDARGADETAVRRTVAAVATLVEQRGGQLVEESWTPPTAFDRALVRRLQHVLPAAPLLGTGAGHDAGILATAGIPAAMIFVRNPTGVSHSPAEFADRQDCLAGVDALTAVLGELAGGPA